MQSLLYYVYFIAKLKISLCFYFIKLVYVYKNIFSLKTFKRFNRSWNALIINIHFYSNLCSGDVRYDKSNFANPVATVFFLVAARVVNVF